MLIELDPVDRITADAVGEPGQRVFYLQARKGAHLVTLLLEKQQVQLLAASVVQILSQVGKETAEGLSEEQMGLEQPLAPEWRVGRLSIGYEEDRDLMVLEMGELVAEEEGRYGQEEEEEEEGGPGEPKGLEAFGPELMIGLEEPEEEVPEELGEPGAPSHTGDRAPDDLESLGDLESLTEVTGEEPNRIRVWATREQMLSLARHSAAVTARGRPRCQYCGDPIDPEGHVCRAMNGHRATEQQ